MSRDISKLKPEGRPRASLPGHQANGNSATPPARSPASIVPGSLSASAKPAPDRAAAQKSPVAANNMRVTRNNTGRVKFDERGNAIWEWAVTTGSFGVDVSTQPLQKLESQLSLADEVPPSCKELVKENTNGVIQGYSPYDSGHLVKGNRPSEEKDRSASSQRMAQAA